MESNAVSGDLYHGTSVPNAASIVSSQFLVGDASHGDRKGISFTRSERLGWDFAGIAEERELVPFEDNEIEMPEGHLTMRGALVILDGIAMRAAMGKRLAPYVWSPQDAIDDEEEERFHGTSLKITQFLKGVVASSSDIAWWAQAVEESDSFNAGFGNKIAALAHSPLFRAGRNTSTRP